MDNYLNLLILPPHCADVLKPLGFSVFVPLKRAVAVKKDVVVRIDPGRGVRTK